MTDRLQIIPPDRRKHRYEILDLLSKVFSTYHWSYYDFFDGVIDDVRLYGGTVLSDGEILQLYNDGL